MSTKPQPPEDWEIKRLHEIATVTTSNVDKKTNPGETAVRLCNYMDVYSNDNIVSDMELMEATAKQTEIDKFTLECGDIIITKDSETPDDIGVPSVVREELDNVVCGYHLSLIRLSSDEHCPVFVSRQISSHRISRYFARQANGSTRFGLNISPIEETEIWLAPPEEQRRIAEILDTADKAIQKTEALIAKLKQMKAGLLHDLLTRGIDENGELRDQTKSPELFEYDERVGTKPKDWSVLQLADVADVDRGKFTHRPRNDPAYYGGVYPFIQTGDVAAAKGDVIATFSQTLSDKGTTVSREFPIGTIAITIAANIADTGILGIPMYFPDSVVAAVVREPNSPRFVEMCIRRAKRKLNALAPQSAQKNINLTDLRPLWIPVPDEHEQKRISDCYEALQCRINMEMNSQAKLAKLKAGLMHDLLTGNKRVNVAEPVTA